MTNKERFIELYKTKIDTQTLNNTILDLVKVLEKNNQKYVDSFPITINPFQFTIEGDSLAKWKQKSYNMVTESDERFLRLKSFSSC